MYGITREKYKQIHSEVLVRTRLSDYAGLFKVQDLHYAICISPNEEVSGYDTEKGSNLQRRFRLLGTHLSGGLLTGTKVYDDGLTAPFEGLFIQVSEADGTSPAKLTHKSSQFALGVLGVHSEIDRENVNRLLYVFQH